MKMRLIIAVVLALGPSVMQVAVAAPDQSEILIREGVELRKRGQDAQAFDRFQTAYELAHSARAAVQLGLCEMALGRWLDSEAHLTEGLASSAPWILRNRAIFEGARTTVRGKLVKVVVNGGPPGAIVGVNGQQVGKLPNILPVYAAPGEVVVVAHSPAYLEQRVTNSASAGETIGVVIDLQPRVERPVAVAAGSAPSPSKKEASAQPLASARPVDSPVPAVAKTTPIEPPVTPASVASWHQAAFVTTGALAGASLVLGAVSQFTRHSAASDFADPARGCDKSDGVVVGDATCDGIAQRFDRSNRLMLVGYVGAAVLATTATILWITDRTHEDSHTGVASACVPATTGTGLLCAFSF